MKLSSTFFWQKSLVGLSIGMLTACGATTEQAQMSDEKIVGGRIAEERLFMAGLTNLQFLMDQ